MSSKTKRANGKYVLIRKLERLAQAMSQAHERMVDDKDFRLADMTAVGAVEAVTMAAVTILKTPEAVP